MDCFVAGLSHLMLGLLHAWMGGDNSTTVSYYEIVKKDALTGTYTSQMGYKVAPLNPRIWKTCLGLPIIFSCIIRTITDRTCRVERLMRMFMAIR